MATILLVDDSRVTRELIKVYLIPERHAVLEAADGEEALRITRSSRPDLVLADMRMPKLDGAALCEGIRADPEIRDIPVLILTSSADAETSRRLRAAGAREVLTKPIQPQPLLDAVHRHLPAQNAARP